MRTVPAFLLVVASGLIAPAARAAADSTASSPADASAPSAPDNELAAAPRPPALTPAISNRRIRFDVGFAHWYADRFRSNSRKGAGGLDTGQLTSLTVGAGFRPGLRWLELRVRFDRTKVHTDDDDVLAPSYGDRHAMFLTATLALTRTLRVGDELLTIGFGAGPLLLRIDGHGQVLGQASGFNIEYYFGPALFGTKLGAFLDAREQGYAIKLLDGTRSDQVDFSIAVGFTVALLS